MVWVWPFSSEDGYQIKPASQGLVVDRNPWLAKTPHLVKIQRRQTLFFGWELSTIMYECELIEIDGWRGSHCGIPLITSLIIIFNINLEVHKQSGTPNIYIHRKAYITLSYEMYMQLTTYRMDTFSFCFGIQWLNNILLFFKKKCRSVIHWNYLVSCQIPRYKHTCNVVTVGAWLSVYFQGPENSRRTYKT